MRYLSIISLLLLMISCRSDLRRHVDSDKDSETIRTYHTDSDGQIQGSYLLTTTSGDLIEESQYVDDQLHGERRVYRSDGTLEILERYRHGLLSETSETYYPSGGVMLRIPYIDGRIQGISYKYDERGQLLERVTFSDNEENGPFEEYHTNGQIHWKGAYLNGPNEYGSLYQYDSTGVLIKEMICDSVAVCRTIMEK